MRFEVLDIIIIQVRAGEIFQQHAQLLPAGPAVLGLHQHTTRQLHAVREYHQIFTTRQGPSLSVSPPQYPVAEAGVSALQAVHGTDYRVGCIPCILYVASGGASDWALGVANSTFSFSMELRDTGR